MEMLLVQAPAQDVADLARHHFAANLDSLARSQPDLAPPAELPDARWLYARDGSLTAMLDGDRWWGNCSVPLAAARFMLRAMDIRGTLGCFLLPMHAAQLCVALEMLHPRQGIIAIVPEPKVLSILLHGHDFSRDIAGGRLWFADGPRWEEQLRRIFDQNPGLPTPIEFIRPILADSEPADQLIAPAQSVFADAGARRGEALQLLLNGWRPIPEQASRVCLLAPAEFRLWDDAPLVLASLNWEAAGLQIVCVDSDEPGTASPLALAQSAVNCGAVLAADRFRSDLPGVTPAAQPWVTWVTAPRIPSAKDAGADDRLLLADPALRSLARQQGWDDARTKIAGWPSLASGDASERSLLSMVVDTHPLEAPERITEYSSQVLLWNAIRDELLEDPFVAVNDIAQYLRSRRNRLQIGDAGFDAALFVEQLIAPAIHQGIAAVLIRERIPVRLFGRGWQAIEQFASHHAGTISSRAELAAILSHSAAVVHVSPWHANHPMESAGRPIVRGASSHELLSAARAALSSGARQPISDIRPISPTLLAGLLGADRRS